MQGAIAEGEAKTFIYGHSPGRETGLGYARVRSALDLETDTRQPRYAGQAGPCSADLQLHQGVAAGIFPALLKSAGMWVIYMNGNIFVHHHRA
jgi:hypothetical protein